MENKQIAAFSLLDDKKLCLVIKSKHPINPIGKRIIHIISFIFSRSKVNDHVLFCSNYGLTRSIMFKISKVAIKMLRIETRVFLLS